MQLQEAELLGAEDDEVLGQPAEMHEREGGGVEEGRDEVAVGHRVEAVRCHAREAEAAGERRRVDRVGGARQGARAERKMVGLVRGGSQARVVTAQRRGVRQPEMRGEDRLRAPETFGSKAVIPVTGIMMNNQMDDFSIHPGTTNYFGLVGAEANAVASGKRPLSSMSPTIVLKNGRPIAALGAAGGPTIISQVVQQLVWMLDFGMKSAEALSQPRIHHQWLPSELVVERGLPADVKAGLAERGHALREVRALGACQVIAGGSAEGFTGGADPRLHGKASGF